MHSCRVLLLTLFCFSQDAITNVIYHCTDPSNGVTVFSDRPCESTTSDIIRLKPTNQVRGITSYERSLIQKLHNKDTGNQVNNTSKDNKTPVTSGQELHCIRNQLRIDKLNLKLKQGYRSRNYNKYHDQLRLYKKYRSNHCV